MISLSLPLPALLLALFAHGNSASSLGGSFFLVQQNPCDYFHTLFLADGGFFVYWNRKKKASGLEAALNLHWRIRAEKSHFLGEGSKREEVTGSVDDRLLTTSEHF